MWIIYLSVLFLGVLDVLTLPQKNDSADTEHSKSPISFKLTKYTNIQIDNIEAWNHDVNDLIEAQIQDNIDANTQIQYLKQRNITAIPETHDLNQKRITETADDSHYIVQSSKIGQYVNEGGSYTELCRRMVGLSKPQICKTIDEKQMNGMKDNKGSIPKSCRHIQENGQNKSGIYLIQPKTSIRPFYVLCDMETNGGGWTHIQKRYDGSQDFYKEWSEYKFGFGDLKSEFWIGLENIYHITGFEMNELLVEITDRDKVKNYAHYKAFGIGAETEGYVLNTLRGFSGEAGDSLSDHLNSKFSTKDLDMDSNPGNCAQLFLGGWWYKSCHISNLNGKFINVPLPDTHKYQGLHWKTFRGHEYCHAGSRMLVRPVQP